MREVSSPFQSYKKLDLNKVQTAIANLAKLVETAPSDVLPIVENLRILSVYKIDSAMLTPEVRERSSNSLHASALNDKTTV